MNDVPSYPVSGPAPSVPPPMYPQPVKKRNPLGFILLGILVLLIIAAGVVYALPSTRAYVMSLFSSLVPSQEVGHLRFLTGTDLNHLGLSSIGVGGAVHTLSYPDKGFVEATQQGNTLYAILKDAQGRTDVYRLPETGDPVALTTDGVAKQSLTISPDGTYLAFMYVHNHATPADVAQHEVVLQQIASGASAVLAQGEYPHFTDAKTLFYVTQDALVLQDVTNRTKEVAKSSMAASMATGPLFLSGKDFIYYDSLAKRFEILRLDHEGGVFVINTVTIPTGLNPEVRAATADKAGVIYGLFGNPTAGHVSLIRYEDNAMHEIMRFPKSLVPRDIIYVN